MALELRNVTCAPLDNLSVSAPDGAIIGVIGEDGAGKGMLTCLAAGGRQPGSGEVLSGKRCRIIAHGEPLNLGPVDVLCLVHALAGHDELVRRRAVIGLERLRRSGATILLVSHELEFLRRCCDEVWWLEKGRLAARGDPRQVLDAYSRHISRRFAEWGSTIAPVLAPAVRRGDGRAAVVAIETVDEGGKQTMVWESGAPVAVNVMVRYDQTVENPVIGIMIRTRIGFEVFGTNTDLEKVRTGVCAAGEVLRVRFAFVCGLCPQEYTLTAASHDADGVWHDWLEDAVAFSVSDGRYTAGVANLRAKVVVERMPR